MPVRKVSSLRHGCYTLSTRGTDCRRRSRVDLALLSERESKILYSVPCGYWLGASWPIAALLSMDALVFQLQKTRPSEESFQGWM